MAQLLWRCWDEDPSTAPARSAEQLRALTPLLLNKGAAALAYRPWARSASSFPPALAPLRDAYRLHAVKATAQAQQLARVLGGLEAARIPVLVVKGCTLARLYPEPGLRPYGDHDLLVPPDALSHAARIVQHTLGPQRGLVDLHSTLPDLPDQPFAALDAEAREVALPLVALRTLGPRHTLALACLHMLRHGVERPLWLCDVALLLEQPDFPADWQRDLSTKEARWIGHALRLAQTLLGARAPHDAGAAHPRLARAVLREWGRARITSNSLARDFLRHPRLWSRLLQERWPNPVCSWLEADVEPDLSPLPLQLASYGRQLLRFATGALRTRPSAQPDGRPSSPSIQSFRQ